MSRLVLVSLLVALVTVWLIGDTYGEATMERRERRQAMRGDYPMDDVSLLQQVFKTPLKRQWCRSGMSYNPVLGGCTLTLAAIRGRGRGYRGV